MKKVSYVIGLVFIATFILNISGRGDRLLSFITSYCVVNASIVALSFSLGGWLVSYVYWLKLSKEIKTKARKPPDESWEVITAGIIVPLILAAFISVIYASVCVVDRSYHFLSSHDRVIIAGLGFVAGCLSFLGVAMRRR